MDEGILFIATGGEYRKEVKRTAERAKNVTDLPICVITDQEIESESIDKIIIDRNPSFSFYDKVRNLQKSPFERTLFLDTDIYLAEDVSELFDLLESNDMAACIDPFEATLRMEDETFYDELPESFPEYNTGLIAYTEEANQFFDSWEESFSEGHLHDQDSFRKTVYESEISFQSISGNYNHMAGYSSAVAGEIKIFHDTWGLIDSLDEFKEIEQRTNSETRHRVTYISENGNLVPIKRGGEVLTSKFADLLNGSVLDRLIYSLNQRGGVKTFKKALKKI